MVLIVIIEEKLVPLLQQWLSVNGYTIVSFQLTVLNHRSSLSTYYQGKWNCPCTCQTVHDGELNVVCLFHWGHVFSILWAVVVCYLKARSNGSNMLVKHCCTQHVWAVWTANQNVVGRCWIKFDSVQTFHPTSSNIFVLVIKNMPLISCLFPKSNIVGWCWIRLNSPASNTIQHWSNTVQHHLTMLDNVWPTCLIRLNVP